MLRVFILAHHSFQWSQNQRHGRTNFMADIHEELNASLVQFTLLTVTCHDATESHLTHHIFIDKPA